MLQGNTSRVPELVEAQEVNGKMSDELKYIKKKLLWSIYWATWDITHVAWKGKPEFTVLFEIYGS